MTPPITSATGNPGPGVEPVVKPITPPPPRIPENSGVETSYRSPKILDLRQDISNPIRAGISQRIATLGDVDNVVVNEFLKGLGFDVVQRLGSFPGFRNPELALGHWNPDEKPDYNGIGNAEKILRNLQPYMGWSKEVLEANIQKSQRGMLYFNQAIETPLGPVPFKMGVLDTELFRQGLPYFEIRASLLPFEDSYDFLRESQEGSTISREEFQERHRRLEADWMGRTLVTFTDERFTAEELIQRRYRHNFQYYERYRFWEGGKGQKQLGKYRNTFRGDIVPEIIVPGFREWLQVNSKLLEVHHPESGLLSPEQITTENFSSLEFVWQNTEEDRQKALEQHTKERSKINRRNLQQTLLNKEVNKTNRPSFHTLGSFNYVLRKILRKLGIGAGQPARVYTAASSHFLGLDGVSPERQRLGITPNPIDQMVILAGYGPLDETDPETWKEMVEYCEAEFGKGAKPNILIRGNNPSKFTFPVRGVPAVAYRFMEGLRTEGMKSIVVVGPPDVGAALEAFESHFAEEIQSRGKRFIYVDTGLGEGGFTKNLKQGLDALPNRQNIAVLSYGDTPRVSLEHMAHHPWRHSIDYAFGANGRDMVLDFMGMNAHYQGDTDGVGYGSKEGNVQLVRSGFPIEFWQKMFENRKSVKSGPVSKILIFLRYSSVRPLPEWNSRNALPNVGKILWDVRHPSILNVPHSIADVAVRSARNIAHRTGSRGAARPPWAALDVEMLEELARTRMDWNADFRARHLDSGGLVDIDGIRDYVVAEVLGQVHPYEHQADLEAFARETLPAYRDRIPALENTPARMNDIYTQLREDLLQREAERPTEEKIGITEETLRRMGFDPEVLPFQEDGEVNPEWLERVVPEHEIKAFERAFLAFANRGNHAQGLHEGFLTRVHEGRPYETGERVSPKIERFVLKEISAEPERMRGLVLEWDFDRIESAVVERAQKKYGEHAEQVAEVQRYFELSTTGNRETPLRSVLMGLKAVDVLRRYHSHLSPAEYQSLYPQLVEFITRAEAVSPRVRAARVNPIPNLGAFFQTAQANADQTYVRKIGESPPQYRARGRVPLLSHLGMGLPPVKLPHSNGRMPIRADGNGIPREVDTQVYFQRDLELLARRQGIMPSQIPHLIAAAGGATDGNISSLEGIPRERISSDRLLAWTQLPEGQTWLTNNQSRIADTWQNRARHIGPGLGMGMASLLGAEYLADQVGISPHLNPHERFMFVVGSSHLVNQGTSALTEVLMNRRMGSAFNYVTTRAVNAGSEAGVQYTLHARQSLGSALNASLLRNYGLQGSMGRMAFNGAKGLAALPFRASWNMGPGLMSSALVDYLIPNRVLAPDSSLRHGIQFGAFFLPDASRIVWGNQTPGIFRTRGMRLASRAFAVGFMADMGFSAMNRITLGNEGSVTRSAIYNRANELHDAAGGGSGLVDGTLELMAPQLSSWWDSMEFDGLSLVPNKYHRQAQEELRELSQVTGQGISALTGPLLLQGVGEERTELSFYQQVDWSRLRESTPVGNEIGGRRVPTRLFQRKMNNPAYRRRFESLETAAAQNRFLQKDFSGWHISDADCQNMLALSGLQGVQSNLGSLHYFPMAENRAMRNFFDDEGHLISGREDAFVGHVYGDSNMGQRELLNSRQVLLGIRILQLQDRAKEEFPHELDRLTRVGRQLGLVDDSGQLVDHAITRQARAEYVPQRPAIQPTEARTAAMQEPLAMLTQ